MGIFSGQTKKVSELQNTNVISENDMVLVELVSGGTRTMLFGDLVTALLENMSGGGTGSVLTVQNISSIQTDAEGKVPASALLYEMNKVSEVLFREVKAPYGFFGMEHSLEQIMQWVADEDWDKFAIGDYFTETTSAGQKIEFEIASKNGYFHCGDQGNGLEKPNIICVARDCLVTTYKYNDTNTNAGGYAGSKMPAQLEAEAAKFSAQLRGYMQTVRVLENNKGGWAWASRRIMLPSVPQLTGSSGFADGYSGGPVAGSLELFTGGNAHRMKGRGYKKSEALRQWYWLADPSSINTTDFCGFGSDGLSGGNGASGAGGVAPLIVLAPTA